MQHGIEAVPFITPWGTAFMNVSDRRFGLPDSECCVHLSGVGGEYFTNELTGHIRYRQARPALTKRCLLIRRTRHPWLLCSVCVAHQCRAKDLPYERNKCASVTKQTSCQESQQASYWFIHLYLKRPTIKTSGSPDWKEEKVNQLQHNCVETERDEQITCSIPKKD